MTRFGGLWLSGVIGFLTILHSAVLDAKEFQHERAQPPLIIRSIEAYDVPSVTLINQHNQRISLERLFADPRPVVMEFFFTTCTTFCDVRAVRLAAVQDELAQAGVPIVFLSISLDPEFDRPERLRAYTTRFPAVPENWWLLTGSVSDIERVQSAFHARNPSADKMLHQPLTFIRAHPDQSWIRLEGMLSSDDLVEQIHLALNPLRR